VWMMEEESLVGLGFGEVNESEGGGGGTRNVASDDMISAGFGVICEVFWGERCKELRCSGVGEKGGTGFSRSFLSGCTDTEKGRRHMLGMALKEAPAG